MRIKLEGVKWRNEWHENDRADKKVDFAIKLKKFPILNKIPGWKKFQGFYQFLPFSRSGRNPENYGTCSVEIG